MLRILFLLIVLSEVSFAQSDTLKTQYATDRDAKQAVLQICQFSGIHPDFIVIQDESIKSAIAYVKNKKRYIKYNPDFIRRILDSTQTDWAAISVLAHEIGHHLHGHTIKMEGSNPGDELMADRYSGFILQKMGATLEESKQAMVVAGHEHGTETHPPKYARLEAIEQGWNQAKSLSEQRVDFSENKRETYLFELQFTGDNNRYYVAEDSSVVWFDQYAKPIKLGYLELDAKRSYAFIYHYQNHEFKIDGGGTIWNETSYGNVFIVGEMRKIE